MRTRKSQRKELAFELGQPPAGCASLYSIWNRGMTRKSFSHSSQSFFFFFKDLFILCRWVHYSCQQTHQKRASDLMTDGCEPPCGCWELNSGPLEEQSVLLTAEPSHQPPIQVSLDFRREGWSRTERAWLSAGRRRREWEDSVDFLQSSWHTLIFDNLSPARETQKLCKNSSMWTSVLFLYPKS